MQRHRIEVVRFAMNETCLARSQLPLQLSIVIVPSGIKCVTEKYGRYDPQGSKHNDCDVHGEKQHKKPVHFVHDRPCIRGPVPRKRDP